MPGVTNTFSANTRIRSASVNTNFTDLNTQRITFVGARAYKAADQTNINNNTAIKVLLDTETFDIGGGFDTGNNKYDITIDGYYLIMGKVVYSDLDPNYTNIRAFIYVNGANVSVVSMTPGNDSGLGNLAVNVQTIQHLDNTDFVELYALTNRTDAGNTSDIEGGAANTSLEIMLVARD